MLFRGTEPEFWEFWAFSSTECELIGSCGCAALGEIKQQETSISAIPDRQLEEALTLCGLKTDVSSFTSRITR
jgi:hypothetical protein